MSADDELGKVMVAYECSPPTNHGDSGQYIADPGKDAVVIWDSSRETLTMIGPRVNMLVENVKTVHMRSYLKDAP